nr:ubiquinol oxidase 4, chloroplastic/chromoplastic [Ipomoea batatas]
MAAVSMMFGVSASSHASFTPKGIGNSSALFTSKSPFRFSSPISFQPFPRFLSRHFEE